MAEFKLGRIRFIWKGAWDSSQAYLKDDIVRYGGRTYVCIKGHTSTSNFYNDLALNWNKFSDGTEWKNDWTATTFYKVNDIVAYGGILYICNTGHTSQATLEADQGKWDLFATSVEWKSDWVAGTVYKANDLAKYGGNIYFCTNGHTAAATNALGLEANNADWDLFSEGQDWKGNWGINTRYKVNDIVKYGGTIYIANTGHTSAATVTLGLENDQSKWDIMHQGFDYKYDWTNSTRYKVNDVVKFGATLYICTDDHTSVGTSDDSALGELTQDIANWSVFVPGLEFEDSWDAYTNYQLGDFVRYGGNSYVAADSNYGQTPGISEDWELLTTGFRLRGDWGDDSTQQDYRIGDVVRHGGYTYLATQNSNGQEPPNTTYWARLNQGIEWQGEWSSGTAYKLGDAVREGLISYICVQGHTSSGSNQPSTDSLGDFWNNLASGAEESALTTEGDILYYSGSGAARLAIGSEGQVLSVSSTGIPEWVDFGQTTDLFYVGQGGANNPAPTNGATLDRPWKTVRYACEQVEYGARNPNANYLLEVNKQFIMIESSRWAKRQIILQNAPFFIGWSYDDAAVQELVGLALDAIILDNRKGGNVNTRAFATKLINQSDGDYFDVGSEDQNEAILDQMLDLIDDVINNVTPANNYQALDSVPVADRYTQTKDTDRPGEADALTRATTNKDILKKAIELGGGYTLPALNEPFYTIMVKTGEYKEVLPIRVPARTVVIGDELRSTRIKPAGSVTDSSDTTYSLAGILHMKSIIGDIVTGTSVSAQSGNTQTQVSSKPVLAASTDAEDYLVNLVQELHDKIDYNINGATGDSTEPPFRGNNTPTTDDNRQWAVRLLELNRDFIAYDVTNYITNTYPAYSYDEAACRADINHYIDAFIYDLIYDGNYQTFMAATFYSNSVDGSTLENMFLLRDATGLRNMSLSGLTGTLGSANAYGTKRPSAGAYASLDPGWGPNDDRVWISNRSPYVQGVTTFGTACVGCKVDGDLHNGGNDSIVSNDFTQVLSDGIGAWITNLGRSEMVSVFTYYNYIGYLAENGGKIRGTNGNNSYGNFGSVAEGVDSTEIPITGTVNNQKLEAQVERVLTDGSAIIHFEYLNAGQDYTEAEYTVTGLGFGVDIDDGANINTQDGGVFEVRLRNPDDGSTDNDDGDPDTFGGRGYKSSVNTAQSGDATSITLSNTEAVASSAYVGMRIVLTAGEGVGQYARITSYNSATKVANVAKESDGTAGWDTWHPTNSISTNLDATTTYSVEPRLTFTGGGGTGAQARAIVSSGRITKVVIIHPGSGYTTAPTMEITDPNVLVDLPHDVRIADGVLDQPTFNNRGSDFETAGGEVTSGDGFADIFQTAGFLNAEGLTDEPQPGANLQIAGDSRYFKIVAVRELLGSGPYTANIQVSPDLGIETAPAHGASLTLRRRYSQVRLTGHDFLDIGTGNQTETNYPNTPTYEPDAEDEVKEYGGGRVFYTSTDQDGNFRVGRLFNVEQSTGKASLNVDAFSLAGLQELSLGAVGLGQGGAVINEFSTDGTFSANSDNVVPTQRAVIAYINSQIGGGSSALNVNAITAGSVNIQGSTISHGLDGVINVTADVNFTGGISGAPVALAYFLK